MGKQSKSPATTNKPVLKPEKKKKGPPFDITQEEYNDLVNQVATLTLEELQEEWILAARYGDMDVLHAIMGSSSYQNNKEKRPLIVDSQDESNGNSALHMAAANGHANVAELLVTEKASHLLVNHAGNTPLHWAAANGHEKVVELLIKLKEVDVLQKNNFGRSILTEGFASQNTNVVKTLLEHDSAAEERLVQGGTLVDDDDEEEEDGNEKTTSESKENQDMRLERKEASETEEGNTQKLDDKTGRKPSAVKNDNSIIHEFDFSGDNNDNKNIKPLKIRELPIPLEQDPFGDQPEKDTTGYGIWAASLVMARWMAHSSKRFHGKRILELGAGCGVPGLAAAYYSDASKVYVTDLNPITIDNLHYNILLNQQQTCRSGKAWNDRLQAGPINWEDSSTWPKEKIDFVIGSDLIYQSSIAPILQKVVLGLCKGQGTFLYVAPDTESEIGRDGLAEFIQSMTELEGCQLVSDSKAPQAYHDNPLANQDDDMCFLHFHELTSAAYRLYEFQINLPLDPSKQDS